ncbi:MAG: 5-(carboxyamino)imidazole ribonucleotide mutase [Planctomycetia bacterium]|nr:5-(carboxyamino)imidazole ribonucleotide mutase [Planctomycetia bacterium]
MSNGHDPRNAPPPPRPAAASGPADVDIRPPVVGIVMGSDSDLPVVRRCLDVLEQFDIPYEIEVLSAHRTPERAHAYASTARMRGLKIIVAAAGGAAHLAGVMASLTTLPVIGIPMPSVLSGADSLYSTVQMPAGIPVATVAIGEAGATNAALLAAEILALSDEDLAHKLLVYRAELRQKVAEKNEKLRASLADAPK